MEKLVEQGGKPGKDRHVPVIEKAKDGITVHAGGVDTPMGEDHYIGWIEVSDDKSLFSQSLVPGDAPEAWFPGMDTGVKARVYCDQHGLWSNKPTKPKS
jgi:superoxide reductase